MILQKGVNVPGLGTFTLSRQKLDVGNNKFILIQRPVFLLSEKFAQVHGLKYDKIYTTKFKSVIMSITIEQRPGTCDSVISDRESALFRPRSCSAVLFPRIEVKEGGNTATMEIIPEENGLAGCITEEQKYNEQSGKEGEGEDDNTNKRESPSYKRLLNRQSIVPAKVTGISLIEDVDRSIKPKTAPERLGSHPPIVPRADTEGDNYQTNVQSLRTPPTPVCLDHCRAGQELCYLCMQRAQKNIPVYFTEERKLKEQEEDQILQQYQHMQDQEAIHKCQLASLANKEQTQKDAAFNLGVAEALRNQRVQKCTEIHKSYIFQKRPLTPPPLLKQEHYYQSLTKQVTDRRDKEARVKQDKELLERLEQVQLAEELAAQRAKYLKEKNEQMVSYKSALDTQVKIRPLFQMPSEPEGQESPFGKHDMNSEKLAEKKKRAHEVYKQQLQAAAERKRMAILNELVQQRKEVEMLQMSKQQLRIDRAAQFEKINRLEMALRDDWVKSSEIKRMKDHEEEKFIQ
ncbi:hypothetical protein FKM82_009833 [Ascaphus truei]